MQHLVAAEIEGAEDDRTRADAVEHAPVESFLVGDARDGAAGEHEDLGAEQSDAAGAGGIELRHLLRQPGIQEQPEWRAVGGLVGKHA